jgi:hypothetical protein
MLYFIIFFAIFLLGFLDVSYVVKLSFRTLCFWVLIVVFIVLASIKWKTGTDWVPYFTYFSESNTYSNFTDSKFEGGYELFSFIIKSISSDYSFFLGSFAFITILLKAYLIADKKYSQFILVSLLLYFAYHQGDIFPIRQSLALSIVLLSGNFIIDRKPFLFLFCVFLASQFHTSSLIFLLAYPLASINIKTKNIVILLISSSVLGYVMVALQLFDWILLVPGLNEDAQNRLDIYTSMAEKGIDSTGTSKNVDPKISFISGLLRKVLVLVPLVIYRKRLSETYKFFPYLFNLIIFGAIFYLSVGSLMQVMKRAASYYDIFEILVIPLFISLGQNSWQRVMIYLFISVYALAKLYMVLNYFWDLYVPFYTIFNDDIRRVMY